MLASSQPEHRHQFMFARAGFRRANGPDLTQAAAAALRQSCLDAPMLGRVPEGVRTGRFAEGSLQPSLGCADFSEFSSRRGQRLHHRRMPGMNGLDMLVRLAAAGSQLPAIVITGQGDIAMAVQAMRAGAADFIEKSINPEALLASVHRVLRSAASPAQRSALRAAAALRIASLPSASVK